MRRHIPDGTIGLGHCLGAGEADIGQEMVVEPGKAAAFPAQGEEGAEAGKEGAAGAVQRAGEEGGKGGHGFGLSCWNVIERD